MLAAYARLAVRVGVNLQPGQRLAVNALLEHAPLVRAVAAEAYGAGRATSMFSTSTSTCAAHTSRASPDESLGWSPPWIVQRLDELGADGGGAPRDHREPRAGALRRPGRRAGSRGRGCASADRGLAAAHGRARSTGRSSRSRTRGGRRRSSASPTSTGSGRRLRRPSASTSPTPWRPGRTISLHSTSVRARSTARRFDSLRYRGPGTDLTVGLAPRRRLALGDRHLRERDRVRREHADRGGLHGSRRAARRRHRERHLPATAPGHRDQRTCASASRAAGQSRSTPTRARTSSAPTPRATTAPRASARSALVDRTSRVGQTGLVFYDTLFDENAASHIALGSAIAQAIPRAAGLAGDGAPRAGHQQLVAPRGLHDRQPRGRTSGA